MLLRRLTKHVKDQNWLAVALDFLIVVVGVFLGLQLGNWNDARADHERAERSIELLRSDFAAIDEAAGELAAFYEGIIHDLEVLVEAVDAGEADTETYEAITNALAYGEVFGDPPPPSGTFRDLESSGNLGLIEDQKLRLRLIEYDQSLANIAASDANINTMLAHHSVAFKRYARFGTMRDLPEADDLDFQDVSLPPVTSIDFDAMVSDPEFTIAAQQHLRLQVGRYINIKVSQSKIYQIREMLGEQERAVP